MPTYTPRLGLKRPEASDSFLRQDFVDNWNILEAAPGVYPCTSATKPTWDANKAGRTIYETDTHTMRYWSGSAWVTVDSTPIGVINQFAGATPPANWLLCDGTTVLKADYPALWTVIGEAYNLGGEGVDEFTLPDLRGRFPVGQDIADPDGDFTDLGLTGGTKDFTLSSDQLPVHAHTINDNAGGHAHTVDAGNGGHNHTINTTSSGHNHDVTAQNLAHTHGMTHAHYITATGNESGTPFLRTAYVGGTVDVMDDSHWDASHNSVGNNNTHAVQGGINFPAEGNNHTHSAWTDASVYDYEGGPVIADTDSALGSVDFTISGNDGTHIHTISDNAGAHVHTMQTTGGHNHTVNDTGQTRGSAVKHLQPYLVVNYIIKAA